MTRHREEWLAAVACGLWAVGFLAGNGAALYVVTPLTFIGVLFVRRFPVTAAVFLAAVLVLGSVMGVPSENPAGLASALIAVYSVGRWATPWLGVLAIAALVFAASWADEFSVATAVFGLFLFGAGWLFGTLVRRRTNSARLARSEASLLGSEDLTMVTQEVVSRERERLAVDAVAVIRDAVEGMRQDAARACDRLDQAVIEAIHSRGSAAVAELRGLLGLLRAVAPATDDVTPGAVTARRRLMDGLLALGACLLTVYDMLSPGAPHGAASVALALVPPAALLLRRRELTTAVLLACLPTAASLVLGLPIVEGLADIAVIGVLAWTVGGSTARWPWTAMTVLAALVLVSTWRDSSGNIPITVAYFAMTLFAGHAWSERDREQAAALEESSQLREHRASEVTRAVTAERLRIARELHDVTSHAVGVMVMQAGAAAALRASSPEQAREALRTVESAGIQALSELSALVDVLGTPPLAPGAMRSQGPHRPLADELADLAERMRATGLKVDLRVTQTPIAAEAAAAAYRLVQEALTNAARHAPGAHVTVSISWAHDAWMLQVEDGGAAHPRGVDRSTDGSGFGLVGLAERFRALGGDLSAGPRPGGGFRVLARIP